MSKFHPSTARFPSVPVIQVDRDNCQLIMKEYLEKAIEKADFVAIDCELSGLGDRKRLNTPDMDERYTNLCRVAQTRAIIALGLSLFTKQDGEGSNPTYSVQTFNVMVLCAEDYIVEPMALNFLVQHGFDFQRQYAKGVHYHRGDTEEPSPLRDIFASLVRNQKPLVLHNGLVDLVFLYHNLYTHLPRTLQAFLADLSQMFPKGIYDSKYLADFVIRTPSSYLEFLFRMEQRSNEEKFSHGEPHVEVSFADYDAAFESAHVEQRHCSVAAVRGDVSSVCEAFADHGHCVQGAACPMSHDIDLILLKKEGKKKRKRKRKNNGAVTNGEYEDTPSANGYKNGAKVKMETSGEQETGEDSSANKKPENCGGHRAGFDAFMTGFVLATFLLEHAESKNEGSSLLGNPELVNKIYLVGKSFPMFIQKSSFTKYSTCHLVKFASIRAAKN